MAFDQKNTLYFGAEVKEHKKFEYRLKLKMRYLAINT